MARRNKYLDDFKRWAVAHRLRACTCDHDWVRSRGRDILRAAWGGKALHFARCIIVPGHLLPPAGYYPIPYTPVFYRYGTPIPFLEAAVAQATMICPDPVVLVRVPLHRRPPPDVYYIDALAAQGGPLYIWQAIKHMETFPDGYKPR